MALPAESSDLVPAALPAASPRKPTLAGLAARVWVLLFLGWLYGGDLLRWIQAQSAEVAALSELPRLWLCLLGCAVTIGAAIVLVMARGKPAVLRLFTIATLSLLFLDFVVLNSRRSPLTPDDQTVLAVQFVAESANREAGTGIVPRDPHLLDSFLEGLGSVPYFVKGERAPGWKVELRERCAGPATEAGEASVGTLIYCVSLDQKHAWVTLVGTPQGKVFGPRAIVSTQAAWVGEVHVSAPELAPEPEPDLADRPVWGSPTPDQP